MTATPAKLAEEDRSARYVASTAELPALPGPRVSVVIVNYNYAAFVGEAIESALQQDTAAWEIIVVDDGSTDDSRQVIGRYAERVQAICQDNAGQCAAYNTGMRAVSGDVVLFLDSDDRLHENALTEIAAHFRQGVSKVQYSLRLLDATGRSLSVTVPHHLDAGDVSRQLGRGGMYCSSPASGNAYRVAPLRALFPLPTDASDRHGADFFLVVASGLLGTVAAIDRPLGDYRVHRGDSEAFWSLSFGNAARSGDEYRRAQRRVLRCRDWLSARSAGRLQLPARLLEFSLEKIHYASSVLAQDNFATRLAVGGRGLPRLVKALWLRRDFGALTRLALTGWALVVLLAPRRLAFGAARYVCNPGSR
jgi:hypothetical protein